MSSESMERLQQNPLAIYVLEERCLSSERVPGKIWVDLLVSGCGQVVSGCGQVVSRWGQIVIHKQEEQLVLTCMRAQ